MQFCETDPAHPGQCATETSIHENRWTLACLEACRAACSGTSHPLAAREAPASGCLQCSTHRAVQAAPQTSRPLQLPNSRRYIKTPGLGPLQPCPQDAATRAVVLSVQPPLVPFAYCHAPPTCSLCNSTASQGPACASEHQVTPPHSRPAPIVGAGEVAARPTVPHSACSTIEHSHQFVRRRAG